MRKFLCAAVVLLLLPACKPGLPDTLLVDGRPIDPLCFSVIGAERIDYIPLKNCGQGLAVEGRSQKDKNSFMVAYKYTDLEDGGVGMSIPYSEYSYIGSYNGKDLIRVNWSGGGTGHFSVLMYVMRLNDDELKIFETITGGDRCNGGLADASMTKDGLISVSQNVTPYDMVAVSGDAKRPYLEKLSAYDDLDACAVCCYGTVTHIDHKFAGMRINKDLDLDDKGYSTGPAVRGYQRCFDTILKKAIAGGKRKFSPEEWYEQVLAPFEQTCLVEGQ